MLIRTLPCRLAAIVLASLYLAPAAGAQSGGGHEHHDHAPAPPAKTGARVGLLLADHGEPPEYNE